MIYNTTPADFANLPRADPFGLFVEGLVVVPILIITGVMLVIGFILYNWPHSEIPKW